MGACNVHRKEWLVDQLADRGKTSMVTAPPANSRVFFANLFTLLGLLHVFFFLYFRRSGVGDNDRLDDDDDDDIATWGRTGDLHLSSRQRSGVHSALGPDRLVATVVTTTVPVFTQELVLTMAWHASRVPSRTSTKLQVAGTGPIFLLQRR